MRESAVYVASRAACLHCGQLFIPSRDVSFKDTAFCCRGCEVVYALIHEVSLERFYALKPARILPLIHYFQRQNSLDWVEALAGFKEGKITLGIEGIQCAACIWLIRELARNTGSSRVSIDAATGKMELTYLANEFNVIGFLSTLQKLGYRLGEFKSHNISKPSSLLWRLGLCWAIAMNNMSVSVAIYLGLDQSYPLLLELFGKLSFALATLSVLIGGSYFFTRAIGALKARVLHFDLPIALGILAAFTGSAYLYFQGRFQEVYFDTVTLFTALMLTGRYLQERLIQKNRNQLLLEGELKDMTVTRIGESLSEIKLSQVLAGDTLLIQPGGLNPAEAELIAPQTAECSLSWISGESRPVAYRAGQVIPAGAQALSMQAMKVKTVKGYEGALLSRLSTADRAYEPLPMIWQWVTRWYVALVLAFAFLGLTLWLAIDPARAPFVFISILVVTCPCSLGIGIPIARALANKALLVRGVFARDAALLDKWVSIRQVFLDKTGTLTLSSLSVLNPEVFDAMAPADLTVLFNAAAHSRHPASRAVYQHLSARNLMACEVQVHEVPGSGLDIRAGDHDYFLGQKEGASKSDNSDYEVNFYQGSKHVASIRLAEQLLESTEETLRKLKRRGIQLHLLSGDKPERVESLAWRLGIRSSNTHAALNPEGKAGILAAADRADTLMLGDGLNDSLAFEKSHLCGAALTERAHLARNSDFFFVTGNLGWLYETFDIAARFQSVLKANLYFAGIYNGGVLVLALAGVMKPLFCALLMPASSLLILGYTMARLREYLK